MDILSVVLLENILGSQFSISMNNNRTMTGGEL